MTVADDLYGGFFLPYITHNLLHIVDDVRRFGPLDTLSTFCYENNMPEFRNIQRKPGQNLEQYYKRLCERNELQNKPMNDDNLKLTGQHANGSLSDVIHPEQCEQFTKLQIGKVVIENSGKNCCLKLKNLEIGIVRNIFRMEGNVRLLVNKFHTSVSYHNVGLSSETVVCTE